jgi:hypothetical protein
MNVFCTQEPFRLSLNEVVGSKVGAGLRFGVNSSIAISLQTLSAADVRPIALLLHDL